MMKTTIPEQCNATCDGLVCDRERGHPGPHRGYHAAIDEPMFWPNRVPPHNPPGASGSDESSRGAPITRG